MLTGTDWMDRALCAGTAPNYRKDPNARDLFFPEKGESYNDGLWMCMNCPVRKECDEHKDKINAKHGLWGAKVATKEDE